MPSWFFGRYYWRYFVEESEQRHGEMLVVGLSFCQRYVWIVVWFFIWVRQSEFYEWWWNAIIEFGSNWWLIVSYAKNTLLSSLSRMEYTTAIDYKVMFDRSVPVESESFRVVFVFWVGKVCSSWFPWCQTVRVLQEYLDTIFHLCLRQEGPNLAFLVVFCFQGKRLTLFLDQ